MQKTGVQSNETNHQGKAQPASHADIHELDWLPDWKTLIRGGHGFGTF
jgi:hypothetical protein